MRDIFKRFDDHFIQLLNSRIKNPFLDKVIPRITVLGGAVVTSIFALGLVVLGNYNTKLLGIEAVLALFFGQIFVQSLKKIMSRERPYKILEQLNTFGIDLRDYSFPSGHTTASFSLATTIAVNMPRFTLIVFVLAFIIGMSRIYLGVHYPTDVAAGIILGVLASLAIHLYFVETVEKIAFVLNIN